MIRLGKPLSLRRELVFWYVLSFVALIAVSNVALYYFLRLGIEADRNSILNDRFNAINELLHRSVDGPQDLEQRILVEWPSRRSETTFFRVKDASGHLVVESPAFGTLGIDPAPESSIDRDVKVKSSDGHKLLVRVRTMDGGAVRPGVVTVIGAVDAEAGEVFLVRQRGFSLGLTLFSALLSLLLGWVIVRGGLRPLETMTSTVEKIDSQNLAARLHTQNLPEELVPLAAAFNQTLDRLEQSFARLNRFSSNIAHELRTPVNNMMGELEVHLGRPRSEAEEHEMLSSTLEECTRLHQIIESLLFLARAERPARGLQLSRLDAASILLDLIDFYEAAASEAEIALESDLTGGGAIYLSGDRTLFQQAVGNLISNAIRYTPRGGKVLVTLREDVGPTSGVARIAVLDSGVGIAAEHLPLVLDRFYRADPSRDHSSGGFGLGLAITKSIMELHGGRVEIASKVGEGTRVELLWPRWTEDSH